MSSPSDEHPLNLDEPALIRTLHDVLRREGYTTEGIVETLGQGDNVPLERLDPPVYLRRLANEPEERAPEPPAHPPDGRRVFVARCAPSPSKSHGSCTTEAPPWSRKRCSSTKYRKPPPR